MAAIATVLSWDPQTLTNWVEVDGSELTNVAVVPTGKEHSYGPGDELALIWVPSGPVAVGRVVRPAL